MSEKYKKRMFGNLWILGGLMVAVFLPISKDVLADSPKEEETLASPSVSYPTFFTAGGDLYLVLKKDGKRQEIPLGKGENPLLTKDGKTLYLVRGTGKFGEVEFEGVEEPAIHKLDIESMKETKVMDEILHDGWKGAFPLYRLGEVLLTNDDRYLFFTTYKWVVSNVVVRLDTRSGEIKEPTHGDEVNLFTDSDGVEWLIVFKGDIIEDQGRWWAYWLFDKDGKKIKKLENEGNRWFLKDDKGREIWSKEAPWG